MLHDCMHGGGSGAPPHVIACVLAFEATWIDVQPQVCPSFACMPAWEANWINV